MSYVTTLICFGYLSNETKEQLNAILEAVDGERQQQFGDLTDSRCADGARCWAHWGGTKGPETDLLGAGLNFVSAREFVDALKGKKFSGSFTVLYNTEGDYEGGWRVSKNGEVTELYFEDHSAGYGYGWGE